MFVSETYTIEDCNYYNPIEVTRTSTNGSTIYDNNLSISLPSKCEISFSFWSNNSTNGEHRYFLLPKSQFSTGTTQPQYGVYIDQIGGNKGNIGKRENNSTIGIVQNIDLTGSTDHIFKMVRDGTSVELYIDDQLQTTTTLSWIGNYTDYTFSMIRWSSAGTSKMKNVKIKQL